MFTFEYLLLSLLGAVVAFQVWLTIRVFRSSLYERKQKLLQAQLIWLLPILGAGLVLHVLLQDTRAEREIPKIEG